MMGLIDPLEVADDVPLNISTKRFGGLDLIIGGCVEVEDLRTSGHNLVIGEEVDRCRGTAGKTGL